MRYIYDCERGHAFDVYAPSPVPEFACPRHSGLNDPVYGRRNLAAELATQSLICDDHIRKAYNGAKIDHNLALQGRPLDPLAPRDKFEARHVEAATGRVYIGDDISGMSKSAQRAILNGPRQPGEPKPQV